VNGKFLAKGFLSRAGKLRAKQYAGIDVEIEKGFSFRTFTNQFAPICFILGVSNEDSSY
jgi:hypothetical protein